MSVKIPTAQIQNLQQIEAVVVGPDESNRLLIINGQFDVNMKSLSIVQGQPVAIRETFTVLVGPVFTRKQFTRAIATASFTKTNLMTQGSLLASWQIFGVDADWDDESGQVELRIEAMVDAGGGSPGAQVTVCILGFAFHVTILAATAAD